MNADLKLCFENLSTLSPELDSVIKKGLDSNTEEEQLEAFKQCYEKAFLIKNQIDKTISKKNHKLAQEGKWL